MKRAFLFAALLCSLLTGCAVGPDFKRPDLGTPTTFKNAPESTNSGSTNIPTPNIESWWQVFGDKQLDAFEDTALKHSPVIASAVARVDEARAQLGISRAALLPSLNGSPQIFFSGETPSQNVSINGQSIRFSPSLEKYNLPFAASYELDLWGRVRRSVESGNAGLIANLADQRGVSLTLTADVAQYYFALRELDLEAKIVADTAVSRRQAVDVQTARYRGGLVNDLDVQRARVQAATAEADLADLQRIREQTANALAITTGIAPSLFIAKTNTDALALPPVIPSGVPSHLLERRPDLAEAEATLHARTADIGVAEANQLPVISLTGNAGFVSADLGSVLNPASQFWNIGPSITIPIFNGGRLLSETERARAVAAEALAEYRRSALVAFREVEDALVGLRQQSAQGNALDDAQAAAVATSSIAQVRYDRGLANYLDVTDAQNSLLQIQRSEAQLAGARYASTVGLIKALGGSWQ